MSILQSKNKDGSVSMIIAGKVTKDAVFLENNRGGKAVFHVNFDKGQFMQCDVWSDRGDIYDIACRLEKGDIVMVMGKYSPYTSKNGETVNCMTADFVVTPMAQFPVAATAPATVIPAAAPADFEEIDGSDCELPF